MVTQPHFLLFCDTHLSENQGDNSPPRQGLAGSGRWHFVLERLDGPERLEAADSEAAVNRERLALLSVVRGLEALEQPSQVTLVTTSRYVSRGLRYGLSSWREADYKWERFGEQRPIRNSDLWRRVDTALRYHGVQCRLLQSQPAAVPDEAPQEAASPATPSLAAAIAGQGPEPCGSGAAAAGLWPAAAATPASLPQRALPPSGISSGREQAAGNRYQKFPSRASAGQAATGQSSQHRPGVEPLFSPHPNWLGSAIDWMRSWRGRSPSRPALHAA